MVGLQSDSINVETFGRYVVVNLRRDDAVPKNQISYDLQTEGDCYEFVLSLKGCWLRMPYLNPGQIIAVICPVVDDACGRLSLDSNQGFLVVEPDRLISVTSVVSMEHCERKVAFSEKFRFPIMNLDLLRGTIAHELISEAMKRRLIDKQQVRLLLGDVLRKPEIMETAYGLGMTAKELSNTGEELIDWVIAFMQTKVMRKDKSQNWTINKLVDIEDCYWSPHYGLKGKIDCTVQATNNHGNVEILPMEFKTGNPNFVGKSKPKLEHLGQVFLYTLLMGDVSNKFTVKPIGFLHYIRENYLQECSPSIRDLQALIMSRNQIVFNIVNSLKNSQLDFSHLPRPVNVNFDRSCSKCEYQTICGVSLKKAFGRNGLLSGTEKSLISSVSHLSDKELDFFNQWIRFVNSEIRADDLEHNVKDLWLKSLSEREEEGKCLGSLKLISQNKITSSDVQVTFEFPEHKTCFAKQFTEKDFVVVGTSMSPCIAFAYVDEITCNQITLTMEREIHGRHSSSNNLFSIDKYKSSSVGGVQLQYLAKLMCNKEHCSKLRKHLITRNPPVLTKFRLSDLGQSEVNDLKACNSQQRKAIIKSLVTDSFHVIRGSPGCGKTHTIVVLLKVLLQQKKKVLLSTFTNNALNNILLKLQSQNISDFIKIGSGGKLCEHELRENSTNYLRSTVSCLDNLSHRFNSAPIVGTTMLNLKHPIFSQRKFDYCVIDEGSQALPSAMLGVFLLADKCVIFGDPNQLPTVIKTKNIESFGIQDSIFSMLTDENFISSLCIQYRMNQSIMKLANQLVYNNTMLCATENQAKINIDVVATDIKKYLHENISLSLTQRWLCLAASRRPERAIMFFDTELIDAYESSYASSVHNIKEKDIVVAMLRLLNECKISLNSVGVIAPYRGQVVLIKKASEDAGLNVEVNTVDQYQGREKNIIILSMTRSFSTTGGNSKTQNTILNDVRRLNVAITRAIAKLIIIGNSATLNNYPECNKLINLLCETQKYKFQRDDFDEHFFKKD